MTIWFCLYPKTGAAPQLYQRSFSLQKLAAIPQTPRRLSENKWQQSPPINIYHAYSKEQQKWETEDLSTSDEEMWGDLPSSSYH